MKILVLCTGNSCRSQMAEGFLRSFDPSLQIASAGTRPEKAVNPFAVKAMKEKGIDITTHQPDPVTIYISEPWDYVITVCDGAKETCPVFTGDVRNRLHIGFEDPASAAGTEEEIMKIYRKTRDEIGEAFRRFYVETINKQ